MKLFLFLSVLVVLFCCTKNSGQVNKSVSNKFVISPNYSVNISCDSCAITDTIMVTGSGFTAGKEISALAQRAEDGWQLYYHATTVDANGNISFEYLYKRPAGHYTLTIYEMLNSKKRIEAGQLTFQTY